MITFTRLLTCCGVAALLAGGSLTAADHPGKASYDKACKSCHMADGSGNQKIGQMMKVTLRALGSKEVLAKSDAELKNAIVKGTGKMKPVTSLTAKQADEVVGFLRTLKQ